MKAPPPAHPRRKRARAKPHGSRAPAPTGFPAFVAYGDIPAARRALDEIRTVLIAHDREYRLEPRLWRFDQLSQPRWRDVALRDAGTAGIVVVASSEPGMLPADTEGWLARLLAQKHARSTTVVIVLGNREVWTIVVEKLPAAGSPSRPSTAPAAPRAGFPARSRAPSAARAA